MTLTRILLPGLIALLVLACGVPIRQEVRPSITEGCVEIWEVDDNWWPPHEELVVTFCPDGVSVDE